MHLADDVPGALAGLYPHLLLKDFSFGQNSLFREADPRTRDILLEWIENAEKTVYDRQTLLGLVAWIDDATIHAAFRRWRDAAPAWAEYLPQPVEGFASVAGWELTLEGTKRNLYFPLSYSLVSAGKPRSTQAREALEMILPHEDHCGWCQQSLITLFDLQTS